MIARPPGWEWPIQLLAYVFFATGIFFSICAVNLTLGAMPVRAICITISLMFFVIAFPANVAQVLESQLKLIAIIAVCATIGLVVSFFNQSVLNQVLLQMIEIHLQAFICLILAGCLIQFFGIRRIAITFLSIWLVSAFFALGQAMGLEIAWQARTFVGDWMNDPAITRVFYDQKQRAVGLSFSPIHLATQTCLAFAALFALRIYDTSGKAIKSVDLPLLGAWAFAVIVCMVSGNRSPLIGFLMFLTIYLWVAGPRWRTMLMPIILMSLLALPFFQEQGRELGLRIASTEDGSALGRSTLWSFGMFLFRENPFGYGLLFESTVHASSFVHWAIHLDNPNIIRHFSLHNYYLLMLNKYGLLILLILPWLLPRNRAQLLGWLAFVPYLVHIAFHNDGPLNSDFLIWFLLPIFAVLYQDSQSGEKSKHGLFQRRSVELKT